MTLSYTSRLIIQNDAKTTPESLSIFINKPNTEHVRACALDRMTPALTKFGRDLFSTPINHETESRLHDASVIDYQPAWWYIAARIFENAVSTHIDDVENIWYCLPILGLTCDDEITLVGYAVFTTDIFRRRQGAYMHHVSRCAHIHS